jgi:hypothetical protein
VRDQVQVLPVFVEAPRKPSHAPAANLVPSAEEATEGQKQTPSGDRLLVFQEEPESDEVQMMPPSASDAATTLIPSAEHATELQSKFVGAAVSRQTWADAGLTPTASPQSRAEKRGQHNDVKTIAFNIGQLSNTSKWRKFCIRAFHCRPIGVKGSETV